MAMTTERLRVVADLVSAAVQSGALNLTGEPKQRAEQIAEAFRVIARAVTQAAAEASSARDRD